MAFDSLESGGSYSLEKKVSDLFATMACHSVVRAGQALSNEEMKELLVQMDEFPLSSFCPHGRPVFKQITFRELDKEFGRIV
jgi:DNA mismatch repair protein MutL